MIRRSCKRAVEEGEEGEEETKMSFHTHAVPRILAKRMTFHIFVGMGLGIVFGGIWMRWVNVWHRRTNDFYNNLYKDYPELIPKLQAEGDVVSVAINGEIKQLTPKDFAPVT